MRGIGAPQRTLRFSPLPSARRAIPWNRSPIRFWLVAVCSAAGAPARAGARTRGLPAASTVRFRDLFFGAPDSGAIDLGGLLAVLRPLLPRPVPPAVVDS